jgi:hypothetical protein
MLETFRFYSTLNIKNPSFFVKYFKIRKSPSAKTKGLELPSSPSPIGQLQNF